MSDGLNYAGDATARRVAVDNSTVVRTVHRLQSIRLSNLKLSFFSSSSLESIASAEPPSVALTLQLYLFDSAFAAG